MRNVSVPAVQALHDVGIRSASPLPSSVTASEPVDDPSVEDSDGTSSANAALRRLRFRVFDLAADGAASPAGTGWVAAPLPLAGASRLRDPCLECLAGGVGCGARRAAGRLEALALHRKGKDFSLRQGTHPNGTSLFYNSKAFVVT